MFPLAALLGLVQPAARVQVAMVPPSAAMPVMVSKLGLLAGAPTWVRSLATYVPNVWNKVLASKAATNPPRAVSAGPGKPVLAVLLVRPGRFLLLGAMKFCTAVVES